MAYVMVISIGPVQGFIASARRTSDFAYGSRLLSELAKAIALKLEAEEHTLVFPAGDLAAIPGVPNKLVAVIEHGEPQAIASALEDALQTQLEGLYKDTLKRVTGIDQQIAWSQIRDLPRFYWAAAAFEEPAGYADGRNRAEALLAARKNTRAFTPVTWGAHSPKSSITGEMESVLPKPTPNDPADAKNRWQVYRAGPHEHLSGVDLLKRHGGVKMPFPSTSHMAAKPYMMRFVNPVHSVHSDVQDAWNEYTAQLKSSEISEQEQAPPQHQIPFFGEVDGAVLFEERLDEYEVGKDTKGGLRKFLAAAAKHGYGSPDPYYAILLGDGDGMGKVIDELAKHGYARHQELSGALDEFVREAQEIIERHSGAPIYIGGDDVLALLPLHTVLQCADEVAEAFADKLSTVAAGLEPQPSLSAGIAIVHHLVPLTDAVDLARAAEKIAKSVKGKNALAITISRRSGGDYTVKAQRAALVERLKQFIGLFAKDKLPSGVAYEIRDLVLRLDLDPEKDADPTLRRAARQDVLRIFKRKQTQGQEIEPETLQYIRKQLGLDANGQAPVDLIEDANGQAPVDLIELAHELVVARALADADHVRLKKENCNEQE